MRSREGRYGKGERERECYPLFSAMLRALQNTPEFSLCLSAKLRGACHSTFTFLLPFCLCLCFYNQQSYPLRPSISPFLRRVQELRSARTPPRANTGQRLLRVSPSRSIFTIFTSRPGTRLPISRLHGRKKRERAALPTFPRLPSTADSPLLLFLFSSFSSSSSSFSTSLLLFLSIFRLNRDKTVSWL